MTRLMSILRALARRSRLRGWDVRGDAIPHRPVRRGSRPRPACHGTRPMRRARLEFGNIDNVKDDCREARGLRMFDELQRDTRHAVRLLRRSPGFTFTALATLALCLGANLTIFAVVDSVLLRPLPFPDAARLMSVFNTLPEGERAERRRLADELLRAPRQDCRLRRTWRPGATARRSSVRRAPPNGSRPRASRRSSSRRSACRRSSAAASPKRKPRTGTDRVAVLTDAFWRQRLNADPNVLGRSLRVNGRLDHHRRCAASRVSLPLVDGARVYFPLASNPDERSPKETAFGEFRHDREARARRHRLGEAQAEIDAHNTALERGQPDGRRRWPRPVSARSSCRFMPIMSLPSGPCCCSCRRARSCCCTIGAVNLVEPAPHSRQRTSKGASGAAGTRRDSTAASWPKC